MEDASSNKNYIEKGVTCISHKYLFNVKFIQCQEEEERVELYS